MWVASPGKTLLPSESVPLVVYPQGCIYRRRATQCLDGMSRRWHVSFSSPSLSGLAAAVAAGLGVSVMSERTVPPGLQLLGEADGLPALPTVSLGLHMDQSKRSEPVLRLRDYLLDQLQDTLAA